MYFRELRLQRNYPRSYAINVKLPPQMERSNINYSGPYAFHLVAK